LNFELPSEDALQVARIGGGDYVAVGLAFLEYFKTLASLGTHEAVLELGCGVGRIAAALTTWLRAPGRYQGLDVVPASISWCQEHITPRHPHFSFECLDVANSSYNPGGTIRADELRFPYEDASFDLVVAVSLFTHLLPASAAHYLAEACRVLRPGGRVFATWFIWRSESVSSSEAMQLFPFDCGSHRVGSMEDPEAVVAFPENALVERYRAAGLQITHNIPGNWERGHHALPYQDMIVAVARQPL
jgi:SAM-dependent methyltransferase